MLSIIVFRVAACARAWSGGLGHHLRFGDTPELDEPGPVRIVWLRSWATLSASRVLPTPPTPVRVTNRLRSSGP